MQFDWTVNLGNILTVGSFVAGGVLFIMTIRDDAKITARRLESVELELARISQAIVDIARQDERMKAMEHRLRLLEGNH